MVFIKYDAVELKDCGRAFVAALNAADRRQDPAHDDTEGWTEFVLNWFAATAGPEVLVDARPPRRPGKTRRETYGEFLADLTHSTYPRYSPHGYWTREYWTKALGQKCLVRLALESEWGKAGKPTATYVEVLKDAIKIAAIRADVKVMIFGPDTTAEGDELISRLEVLRESSQDPSPWLVVAFPWKELAAARFEVLPR
jgi:hypothetical protein